MPTIAVQLLKSTVHELQIIRLFQDLILGRFLNPQQITLLNNTARLLL